VWKAFGGHCSFHPCPGYFPAEQSGPPLSRRCNFFCPILNSPDSRRRNLKKKSSFRCPLFQVEVYLIFFFSGFWFLSFSPTFLSLWMDEKNLIRGGAVSWRNIYFSPSVFFLQKSWPWGRKAPIDPLGLNGQPRH